jgi:DNA-binding transcriptional ArsR family regulator
MKENNRRILALFSHPARVKMIQLLAARGLGTGELGAALAMGRAGAIVHLNHLINEQLIHSRRYGKRVRYWLNRERLIEALSELGESVGFEIKLRRGFKTEVSDEPPPPLAEKDKTRTILKERAKRARAAERRAARDKPSKKATKKQRVKKAKATKKKATKKKATKKKATKKKATKKKATRKK